MTAEDCAVDAGPTMQDPCDFHPLRLRGRRKFHSEWMLMTGIPRTASTGPSRAAARNVWGGGWSLKRPQGGHARCKKCLGRERGRRHDEMHHCRKMGRGASIQAQFYAHTLKDGVRFRAHIRASGCLSLPKAFRQTLVDGERQKGCQESSTPATERQRIEPPRYGS